MSELFALASQFWAWRTLRQPISNDDLPRMSRPPGWTPDWSRSAVDRSREDLEKFEARWRALDVSRESIATQVDYRLIGSALARVHWELDILRPWRRDPWFYVAQTVSAVVDVLLAPPPLSPSRGRDLIERLRAFPRILQDAQANLDQAVQPFARLAIEDLDGLGQRLDRAMSALRPHVDEATRRDLPSATDRAVIALDEYRSWLSRGLDKMPVDAAIGLEAYLYFLRRVALMPFSPEALLDMGRHEWARSVTGESLAAQRNHGLPQLPLLPDQDSQIEQARRDEVSIRRYLTEKRILTVPDWMPCYVYRPFPQYLAELAGFGEPTDFTSPERLLLGEESARWIPAPSADLPYFPLSMAFDPRVDMVHEGIPGHAFQLALSWRHDDEIRRQWYDSGANEGIGLYAEEMMLEMGLFDDSPRTREMVWNYMRLRALRVEVDVRLALGTFTVEEAADYLQRAVPVDRTTARTEAAYFASAPGFAIGYQIGKLQILQLLAEARQSQGAAFDLCAFHDFVWRNGNVPISLQRWELLGLRDEVDALDAWQPGNL